MQHDNEALIEFGGSKRISVADDVRIKAKRVNDDWGVFDQEQGFHLYDVPNDFRTESKVENYKLSLKEEKQQKLILTSKPYHIDLEPTNICNLRCPLCSTGVDVETRKKGTLTFEKFKHLIDQSKDTILHLSLQNWGEATLVKDLPKMIKYASENGVYTRLSTNFSIKYNDSSLFFSKAIISAIFLFLYQLYISSFLSNLSKIFFVNVSLWRF